MPPTASRPFGVLVVDDEPDVRDLLIEYFEEKGHEVAALGDGRAAVTEIQRNPARYGVVVTDLQLPGADGLAVLTAARQANSSAVVIIVTGYASLDSAVQAVRLGAYDYLTKPFSLGQLDVIIERVSERNALEAENRQLARRVGDRESSESRGSVTERLDAIDARLSRIEALLERITAKPPRF
jgi:DNA-binding NtrC family response regulator